MQSLMRRGLDTALDFGLVRVVAGSHSNKIGYYDDDDDDPENAIVYFNEPFIGGYCVIPKRYLRKTTISTLAAQRFKRQYPNLVKEFGVEI